MDALFEKLDEVFAGFTEDEKDSSGYIHDSNRSYDAEQYIWAILRECHNSTSLMCTEMRKHGYNSYPTEKDSFGWLVGCVEKNGYKVLFG